MIYALWLLKDSFATTVVQGRMDGRRTIYLSWSWGNNGELRNPTHKILSWHQQTEACADLLVYFCRSDHEYPARRYATPHRRIEIVRRAVDLE